MSQAENSVEVEQKSEPKKHWILWTLLALFIVTSIGVMFGVDYYFAPDAKTTVPGAPEN